MLTRMVRFMGIRELHLRAAPALWVLVFSHGRIGWTLLPYAEGGLVRRGRRTPLLFGPEGMRRSEVHAAGVLRMKQAAYYHTAN